MGEIGFSYFGSDAYAPGHRWGFYPAVSTAWIVSNESFLASNSTINFLKLRASVGKTGGDNAGGNVTNNGRYLYQEYYNYSGAFYVGNGTPTSQNSMRNMYIPNPNIGPETSLKYNVGVELKLIHRLDITFDTYMDKRSGIVTLDNSIPYYYGNYNIFSNIGKMTNKGIEATASYADKIGEFIIKVFAMASYNHNTIDYMAELPTAFAYNAMTGLPYGTPIGLVDDGFYQTNDFNEDGSLKTGFATPTFGPVQPGDIRYKDLNDDKRIDQTDITAIGKSPFPKVNYSFGGSFSYHGFDLNILFQGNSQSSISLLSSNQTIPFVNNATAYSIAQGAWAYYPEQGIDTRSTATFPRLTTTGNTNNYRLSSFWIKNNDYLRIRNIELGYSLSDEILKKFKISNLRVFVSTTNPITWSKILADYHLDPESFNGYPALKTYNVGITANF